MELSLLTLDEFHINDRSFNSAISFIQKSFSRFQGSGRACISMIHYVTRAFVTLCEFNESYSIIDCKSLSYCRNAVIASKETIWSSLFLHSASWGMDFVKEVIFMTTWQTLSLLTKAVSSNNDFVTTTVKDGIRYVSDHRLKFNLIWTPSSKYLKLYWASCIVRHFATLVDDDNHTKIEMCRCMAGIHNWIWQL